MATRCLSLLLCIALIVPSGWASEAPPDFVPEAATESRIETAITSPEVAPASESLGGGAQPLSPDEESSLRERAEDPGPEVAGGALSNQHLTYAVIALAAVALVLIFK